ncbi:MAG: hypothetical protein ABWZ85_01235 [Luteibacter sp.]
MDREPNVDDVIALFRQTGREPIDLTSYGRYEYGALIDWNGTVFGMAGEAPLSEWLFKKDAPIRRTGISLRTTTTDHAGGWLIDIGGWIGADDTVVPAEDYQPPPGAIRFSERILTTSADGALIVRMQAHREHTALASESPIFSITGQILPGMTPKNPPTDQEIEASRILAFLGDLYRLTERNYRVIDGERFYIAERIGNAPRPTISNGTADLPASAVSGGVPVIDPWPEELKSFFESPDTATWCGKGLIDPVTGNMGTPNTIGWLHWIASWNIVARAGDELHLKVTARVGGDTSFERQDELWIVPADKRYRVRRQSTAPRC